MTGAMRVLINGAGPAGLSAAVALAGNKVEVDVTEITPDRSVLGSELMLSSTNLRALSAINVADELVARGVPIPRLRLRASDDTVIATVPVPSVLSSLPPSVGVTRRILHDVLYEAAVAVGARIHHGATIERLAVAEDKADVTLTNGASARYDLVVGADGVRSRVRSLAFPDAPQPQYVGQYIWRARIPRQGEAGLDTWRGDHCIVGIITVNDDTAYLFCTVDAPAPPRLERAQFPRLLREHLEPFGHGLVAWSRDRLGGPDDIHLSPLMWLVHQLPWHVQRVVLIGDAAHATTPHIGYGAGLAVEDGLVLAEEIARTDDLETALSRFAARRFERCRMVVEGGVQISRWQQSGEPHGPEEGQLTDKIWRALAEAV